MDVLRPVVELINFNLNVIKICGFPAFSSEKLSRKSAGKVSGVGRVCFCTPIYIHTSLEDVFLCSSIQLLGKIKYF